MKGVLLPLTAVLLTVGAQPAAAAFPGTNGLIALERHSGTGVDIATVNGDGTGDRSGVISGAPFIRDPSWAPDGRRLAFSSDGDGNDEIYVYDTDSGVRTRVTFDPAPDREPAWSPDGTRLVFQSARDGNPELYVVAATGGTPARLTFDPADDRQPAWSTNGAIAFASNRTSDFDLFSMAEDGSAVRRLTDEPGWDADPAWSPAGDRLAYIHSPRNAAYAGLDVRVSNADGTDARPLADTGAMEHYPTWSPDGTRIAYVVEGGGPQVFVTAADGSQGSGTRVASGTKPNWGPVPAPVGDPDVGKTVTIAPLDARVLIAPGTTERPDTSAVLRTRLRGAGEVPSGTTVDASGGTIAIEAITTTPDGPNTVGRAEVTGGVFTISQAGTAEPTLQMRRGIRPCQRAGRARAARVPPEARMRIRARGRFRTVGGYGRGAARGTVWSMRERCDGTIFQVSEGVVLVDDFRRKRSFRVTAGRCYLAAVRERRDARRPSAKCPPVRRRGR